MTEKIQHFRPIREYDFLQNIYLDQTEDTICRLKAIELLLKHFKDGNTCSN